MKSLADYMKSAGGGDEAEDEAEAEADAEAESSDEGGGEESISALAKATGVKNPVALVKLIRRCQES